MGYIYLVYCVLWFVILQMAYKSLTINILSEYILRDYSINQRLMLLENSYLICFFKASLKRLCFSSVISGFAGTFLA